MSKPDVKAAPAATAPSEPADRTIYQPRRTYFYTAYLRVAAAACRAMDDLWFVGLTALLAALTWIGVALCVRLLQRP
jgi:hypothetical protein